MAEIKIFGIRNCDKIKKTLKWFKGQAVPFDFHDYKKQGVDRDVLEMLLEKYGWAVVLNTRGTTWRKLPNDLKAGMNNDNALHLASENMSIIKRPVIKKGNAFHIGYDEDEFSRFLL